MAIQPITSANFVINKNNNVAFGKKENDKRNQTGFIKASSIAVPLATLIAMSPVNSAASGRINYNDNEKANTSLYIDDLDDIEQSAKVINSKKFYTGKGMSPVNGEVTLFDTYATLKFIDTNSIRNDFERVETVTTSPTFKNASVTANVDELAKYNYTITSDDGSSSNSFSFMRAYSTDANAERTKTEAQDLCQMLEEELNSIRNNTNIKQSTYDIKLRASATSEGLQNVPNKDIMKNAAPVVRPDYKRLGTQDFEGQNGKYKISYYAITESAKKAGDNIEFVTVKKEGYPELAVMANYPSKGKIVNNSGQDWVFNYGITILKDQNNKKYCISDMALSQALTIIYNNEKTDGDVYKCELLEKKYAFSDKGIIVPLD